MYVMCVFCNHGTHDTNHCVRASVGVSGKLAMLVVALVDQK